MDKKQAGFILLEVIISLVIMAVTITTILRSFSVSIRGTHKAEIATVATILAEELLHEFEIQRPEGDEVEGDFSRDGFPNYFWSAKFEELAIDYPDITLDKKIGDLKSLKQVTIDVYYDDKVRSPYRAVQLVGALTGLEKFTYESKRENLLY